LKYGSDMLASAAARDLSLEEVGLPARERIDSAKAAAPYFAPRRGAVEIAGPGGGPIQTAE